MEPPSCIVNCKTNSVNGYVPLTNDTCKSSLKSWRRFCNRGVGVLGKWIPYLAHRNCQPRAHLERFSYFLHNQQITAERFYQPMLRHGLNAFAGEAVLLTLDTSMLWDQFCLIEVCLVWGGRSFTLAQTVLKHGSATVVA